MQVTGRIYVSMNGTRIRSKEGAKMDFGGVKRNPETSDSGVDGYSETTGVPRVDCTVNHTTDTSIDDFRNFKDGTLVFETDTGRVYTMTEAFCAETVTMTKGDIALVFMGSEVLEG